MEQGKIDKIIPTARKYTERNEETKKKHPSRVALNTQTEFISRKTSESFSISLSIQIHLYITHYSTATVYTFN